MKNSTHETGVARRAHSLCLSIPPSVGSKVANLLRSAARWKASLLGVPSLQHDVTSRELEGEVPERG